MDRRPTDMRLDAPAVALVVGALAGCGATTTARPTTSGAQQTPAPAGVAVEKTCGDGSSGGGACTAGFRLDGVDHHTDCTAVRREVVAERLGAGEFSGRQAEVRAIRAVSPTVAIAVVMPGGGCGDGEAVNGTAVFAYPLDAAPAAKRQAVCRAGLLNPEQRAFHRCAGPALRR